MTELYSLAKEMNVINCTNVMDLCVKKRFARRENLNEATEHKETCFGTMKHELPVKNEIKSETRAMDAPFGKETDFDFKESLKETIMNDIKVWKHLTGNGNSRMDVVVQANDINKTQLSNGHPWQLKKRTSKNNPNWNPMHGKDKSSHLNNIERLDDGQ